VPDGRYPHGSPDVITGMRGLAIVALATTCLLACGQEPAPLPLVPVASRLADTSTPFGLQLTDRLLAQPGGGNVFVSPLSITLALSMAASGAHSGPTRDAILKTLGLDPSVDPSSDARANIERLAQSDPGALLQIANAIWIDKQLSLSPAYVAKARQDYKAPIANLDFRSPDAPNTINDWVGSATHGKIKKLVDQLDPQMVAFLANATYFKADWATAFDASQTRPMPFQTFDGATQQVKMMYRTGDFNFVQTPEYMAVLLPYKSARFSMLVLLPTKSLSRQEFSSFLNAALWQEVRVGLHKGKGSLGMPRISLDYNIDLSDTLKAMGMGPAMNDTSEFADLCGSCYISQVVHATHLEIDEQGTTAAASTGVGMMPTSIDMNELNMVVDHPFALGLLDNATGAPLFLGVVGQLS
jgi:serine protease inhibitor